jgi:hypothetical protein
VPPHRVLVAVGLENHFGGTDDGGRRLPASVRQFTDSPGSSPALRSPASNAICGHDRCRAGGQRISAGGYCRKALVAGGDPLSLRRCLGTVTELCRLQGYRAEQKDDQYLGRPGRLLSIQPGILQHVRQLRGNSLFHCEHGPALDASSDRHRRGDLAGRRPAPTGAASTNLRATQIRVPNPGARQPTPSIPRAQVCRSRQASPLPW